MDELPGKLIFSHSDAHLLISTPITNRTLNTAEPRTHTHTTPPLRLCNAREYKCNVFPSKTSRCHLVRHRS
eukprot:2977046-Amphidinium_carterae.1